MSKALLDTHAWIWLANGDPRFKNGSSLKMIEKASKSSELYVASISIWEIGMLEAKGRVRFQMPCLEWVKRAVELPGLSVIDLSAEIAIESSRLPGVFHGDPADRILVATARSEGLTILTQDQKILDYAEVGFAKAAKLF